MKFMTHSSIVNYIQAVVLAHKFRGISPPSVSSSALKMTLAGVKRVGRKPSRSRDPITIPILLRLYAQLNLSKINNIMFWACCLLLFRTLLRVSHVVTSPHTLKICDVVWDKNGVVLKIKSSKTSSTLRSIPITKCQDNRLCAVFWLKRWLDLSTPSPSDYLFTIYPNVPLSYAVFSSALSRILCKAHIEQNITSHSFRQGGATFLSELGVPLAKIKERGGWRSNAVYSYLSDSLESKFLLDSKVSHMINVLSSG